MIDDKKAENQSEQGSREPASGVNREAILAGLLVLGIGGYNMSRASTAKQRVHAMVLIAVSAGVLTVGFFT